MQGPALGRTHGPRRECAPRRSHRGSNVSCTDQRDLRDRLLSRWVDNGAASLRFGHDPLPANKHALQAASAPEVLNDGGVHGVGPLETASGLLIANHKSVAMDTWQCGGCVMMGLRSGLLDVQKFRPRASLAGAVMRVLHKASCGCASRYSRSCHRAYVMGLHIGRTRPVAATPMPWLCSSATERQRTGRMYISNPSPARRRASNALTSSTSRSRAGRRLQ